MATPTATPTHPRSDYGQLSSSNSKPAWRELKFLKPLRIYSSTASRTPVKTRSWSASQLEATRLESHAHAPCSRMKGRGGKSMER
ncbi:hypothetical protein Q8A67_002951 [Cirrhinus molitorella]|uniref:Uncharacterized protein n=1 Tax=Cirrhinus molitorella TaxID=172907 RepID=A0AA88U455_9TELE|nr:hypothetical protein Q8A67_002951 [Cirrhinus molitorella]